MKMHPLKRREPSTTRASAKDHLDSYQTVKAILLAPAVAIKMMNEEEPAAAREATLWLYLRDLCRTLPLDTALAVGAAALDDAAQGCGVAFARWHTIRLTSKEPSLDDVLNAVWSEDMELRPEGQNLEDGE
ncbi:hypothetical protein [Armatimonas rosea]|uniref:Uncharacterized protein n=1 Tax=Armatimonas rosea TaxID=685828 RepID=A0A7W9W906_ARMRO|nr:hypothetical protein [Armatimonas rosea]MBB6054109.1 hypothetical protein [Armatimonas rosea]